jgi:alkanesulfonate monooxygenase SsuD/methylene tetrahydromethanopterin reductase-like flavin-dependent oxidoreductase (luciferase family)
MRIVCNPKPVQQPGPPVLIGSTDKHALRWVARWGDGYNPVCFVTPKAVSFMRKKISELKEECAKVGRDFSQLDITLMISLEGERSAIQEMLAQLGELGVHRVVEVSASEPLFVGDYRAKIARLARVAL